MMANTTIIQHLFKIKTMTINIMTTVVKTISKTSNMIIINSIPWNLKNGKCRMLLTMEMEVKLEMEMII